MFEVDQIEDLEDLYENAPCGYLSMTPDGRVAKVNATLCSWIGRSPHDVLGKRLHDLLNTAGSIFYETHFSPMLRMQGYFHEVALDFVKSDGEIMPVLVNASERRDNSGSLISTRLAIFKAKERRQYERELVEARSAEQDARRRLEEMVSSLQTGMAEQIAILLEEKQNSELKEQFVAVLGHDLRNPLAAINAGVNKLLRDGTWTDSTSPVLHMMKNTVSRMSGLIDNVLDLARGRLGGGIVLHLDEDRPLQPTLELVVDEIRTANPQRVIAASYDIAGPVRVDHDRIAQMLSNLLGNAVDHGSKDDDVRVECVVDGDGKLELSVANAGEPIAPEMIPYLFQPFHRGHVRRNARGLGLGLYIASSIARAHGGQLDVVSSHVETRFIFRMSAQQVEAQPNDP